MAKTNMNQNQVLERKKPTPSLDPVSDGNNAMQQFVAPQVVQTNSPVFYRMFSRMSSRMHR